MRRLVDFDEYNQPIPKNKPFKSLESGELEQRRIRDPKYVTQEEFTEMQESLKEQLAEQTTVLQQLLLELKQSKLHLASLSGEDIDSEDIEGGTDE